MNEIILKLKFINSLVALHVVFYTFFFHRYILKFAIWSHCLN